MNYWIPAGEILGQPDWDAYYSSTMHCSWNCSIPRYLMLVCFSSQNSEIFSFFSLLSLGMHLEPATA